MWSTPRETLVNIVNLLMEGYYIIFFFLFISFILTRALNRINILKTLGTKDLYYVMRYFRVFEVLSLKWKCTWGFLVCYLRSKRAPYLKV